MTMTSTEKVAAGEKMANIWVDRENTSGIEPVWGFFATDASPANVNLPSGE